MPGRTWIVMVTCAAAFTSAFGGSAHAGASCLGERATIVGTGAEDVLRGTAERDVIVGGRGADIIRGLGATT